MLQKRLAFNKKQSFFFFFFLQYIIFLKKYAGCPEGEKGFLNSDNVGLRGDEGLKIDVFVGRLLLIVSK